VKSTGAADCEGLAQGARAFEQGLRDRGHVLGRTVTVKRSCPDSLRSYSDLVRQLADIVVAVESDAVVAVTGEILIVSVFGTGRPTLFSRLGAGAFEPFDRPSYSPADGKRLELLKALVPAMTRVAVLSEGSPVPAARVQWDAEGRRLDLSLRYFDVTGAQGLDNAIEAIRHARLQGVAFREGPLIATNHTLLMRSITNYHLPTAFAWTGFAEDGALLAYGVDVADLYRRLAGRIDELLRGVAPVRPPVEQPRLALAINARTARGLGVTIPAELRRQADRVIE
jgi:putative ABC transport system substrate-binding protein